MEKHGRTGIVISAIIIGIVIYKSLKIIKKYEINTYDELLKKIIVKKKNRSVDIEIVLNFIINIFLLITFFIMCAGFSAYFKQEFAISEIYTSIVISILSYIVLSKNSKGIFVVNSILMPLIIVILIILGVKSLGNTSKEITSFIDSAIWIPKAILYSSYNCITLTSMLIPMRKYIKEKKDFLKISLISICIIILLANIIFIILMSINTNIGKIELPAVYASRNVWKNI